MKYVALNYESANKSQNVVKYKIKVKRSSEKCLR